MTGLTSFLRIYLQIWSKNRKLTQTEAGKEDVLTLA